MLRHCLEEGVQVFCSQGSGFWVPLPRAEETHRFLHEGLHFLHGWRGSREQVKERTVTLTFLGRGSERAHSTNVYIRIQAHVTLFSPGSTCFPPT